MQEPSSTIYGVSGSVGTAAQVVPTTKYSVGSSFYNRYGDKYAAITVKCDTAFTLLVFGSGSSGTALASTADTTAGKLLTSIPGCPANGGAATGMDGAIYYVRIAGNFQVLPVVYQASGGNAAVTMTYKTF